MKKFIAFMLALSAMPFSVLTVHAENIPDYSLWDRFIKYDLRITDYDALSDEEKDLCKFIFETERSADDTIICERARRILAGYDVGERITEQFGITFTEETLNDDEMMSEIFENLENYFNVFDRSLSCNIQKFDEESVEFYRDLYEDLKDVATLNVVPDIRHIDIPYDYNEYWFDDNKTAGLDVYDNIYYYNFNDIQFIFNVYGDPFNYFRIERSTEPLPTMEYEGCTYQICPDNTLAFYSLDDKTVSSVEIPESIDNMEVIGIKMLAFEECDIESVHLPETISYIESLAFYKCDKLHDINFQKSLDSMGDASFSMCGSLKDIVIDCPNLKFSDSAFYECSAENIYINTKAVPEWFTSCFIDYNSLTLGNDVKEVGCSLLNADVEIPESVNIVTWGNAGESITVPKNIEILGAYNEAVGRFGAVSIGEILPEIPLLEDKSIFESSDGIINGYYGTETHSYALSNNLKFTPLDNLNYGDINNDGKINIADAVSLQKYLFGNGSVGYEADVNKDGYVDSFDMVCMRKMLLNNK
ncbi:MAG: leucine-rich repeat protein [Ruminococcus flavefaciens]|nr:leucine-rich repeat protein [Ruminococcus flavefaciens]